MTHTEYISEFVSHWTGRGYEKGESQPFWIHLLRALGMESAETYIRFEDQVHLDHTAFIDGYIPSTHVLIEQKSIKKELSDPIKQSDGTLLTPFQQAKRYAAELPYSQRPRWIVTCNFREFWVYDMEQPNGEPEKILLSNLAKESYRLQFLVDNQTKHITAQEQISIQAGQLIGKIYDLLQSQYLEPDSPETLRYLNILCVRLVFCLYAEDAGVFPERQMFGHYLKKHAQTSNIRKALRELFEVFDTPVEQRDPYMDDDLKAFPYVSGGLFADRSVVVPNFTEELTDLLIERTSEGVDWSDISPTIFGAVFESTLNPDTRRSGGMHYTSVENIHKVIDPLFMDELYREFRSINAGPMDKKKIARLDAFQDKLASLTFFDPACGSGNFLTETYLSLRRLENEVIQSRLGGQMIMGDIIDPIKVKIDQFYGIEINDFAVTVAQTALWIAEAQMMIETEKIVHKSIDFLPLKSYAHVVEGNALRRDWKEITPENLNYIMGNPPFVGARMKSESQAADMLHVFGKDWKNVGNLDYVGAWYYKAAQMMFSNEGTRTAFVSTNSITQGEQVPILWEPICLMNMHIDFAYRTFRWDSESNQKAHVHCVIVGFSNSYNTKRYLYFEAGDKKEVSHINAYLVDGIDVFIESHTKPLCQVPVMGVGSQPIDDGNYMFTEDEKEDFIKREPASSRYFHRWYGADEFINNKVRYCLWLGECSPSALHMLPLCLERVKKVREFRLLSKRSQTLKAAEIPHNFAMAVIPHENYLIVPKVSSERRYYVPLGFMSPDAFCSDLVFLLPKADLFHFGVLTSFIHMAWMRAVCGRLKSDYRYSKDIVYNNFPWPTIPGEKRVEGIPELTEDSWMKIEQTAQGILDARALYPECSLADLYDEVTMPPELRKAHQANDRAVMAAYGFPTSMSESDCVAKLLEMYQALTK